MYSRILRLILLVLFLLPVAVLSRTEENVQVNKAYIRLLPPTATTTALFFEIENKLDKEVKLVKAESAVAKMVEVHTHIKEDGMFKMREVPEIKIAARSTHRFQPGGDHIMLIGLHKPLKENQEVEIKLTFADGRVKVIHPKVKRMTAQ